MIRTFLILSFLGGINLLAAQTFVLKPDGENGKDAEIWSYQIAPTDGGTRESSNVFTWTMNSALAVKRSLIEFNLDSLPPAENLVKATLHLYYNPIDRYESVDGHSGNNGIFIERILSEWEEHEVYWSNQPGTTAEDRVVLPASQYSYQDYINIQVTPLVRTMLEAPQGNHGFMIKMQDEFNPYSMCLLASSDHPNPKLRPTLILEFDEIQSSSLEEGSTPGLKIYPNPVMKGLQEKVHFSLPTIGSQPLYYKVFDASGKTMMEEELPAANQAIDVSDWERGFYFLVINTQGKATYTTRIVIL